MQIDSVQYGRNGLEPVSYPYAAVNEFYQYKMIQKT